MHPSLAALAPKRGTYVRRTALVGGPHAPGRRRVARPELRLKPSPPTWACQGIGAALLFAPGGPFLAYSPPSVDSGHERCLDLRCYFCAGDDGYDAVVDLGGLGSVIVFMVEVQLVDRTSQMPLSPKPACRLFERPQVQSLEVEDSQVVHDDPGNR